MPVKLLLGRATLLTRPTFTGSWLAMKTIRIVVVAALAAKRVHRGRAPGLNSRQFGVLCAEAALNAASTFHRSAVVDRANIKSMSPSWLMAAYGRYCCKVFCPSELTKVIGGATKKAPQGSGA